jgi:hypothetical protein
MKRIYNWSEYSRILESSNILENSSISKDAANKFMWCLGVLRKRSPFFGPLTNKLKFQEDWNLPYKTMATDGSNIYYDPNFVMKMSNEEIIWVIVHEIMHCILGHFNRKMPNPQYWNAATDYALNLLIDPEKEGNKGVIGKMPEGGLFDRKFEGYRAEDIYNYLVENQVVLPPEAGWNYGGVKPPVPPKPSGGGSGGGSKGGSKVAKVGDFVKLPNGDYGEIEDINTSGDIRVKPITQAELIAAAEAMSGKKVKSIY